QPTAPADSLRDRLGRRQRLYRLVLPSRIVAVALDGIEAYQFVLDVKPQASLIQAPAWFNQIVRRRIAADPLDHDMTRDQPQEIDDGADVLLASQQPHLAVQHGITQRRL